VPQSIQLTTSVVWWWPLARRALLLAAYLGWRPEDDFLKRLARKLIRVKVN
jgi:hypothetical protein